MVVPAVSRAAIVAEAARDHGLSREDLLNGGRQRRFAWARHDAAWRLAQVRRADGKRVWSYSQIAAAVGLKDHSSAMHGVANWGRILDAERAL